MHARGFGGRWWSRKGRKRPAIVEFAFTGWRRLVALGALLGRESPRRSAEARGRRRSEAGAAMRLCRCQRRRKGKGVRGRHRARGDERHERSTDWHGGAWAAVIRTRGSVRIAWQNCGSPASLSACPCHSVAAGARMRRATLHALVRGAPPPRACARLPPRRSPARACAHLCARGRSKEGMRL